MDSQEVHHGQYHLHPQGQINCVMPLDDTATSHGNEWLAEGGLDIARIGPHHYPEVRGGALAAHFFFACREDFVQCSSRCSAADANLIATMSGGVIKGKIRRSDVHHLSIPTSYSVHVAFQYRTCQYRHLPYNTLMSLTSRPDTVSRQAYSRQSVTCQQGPLPRNYRAKTPIYHSTGTADPARASDNLLTDRDSCSDCGCLHCIQHTPFTSQQRSDAAVCALIDTWTEYIYIIGRH